MTQDTVPNADKVMTKRLRDSDVKALKPPPKGYYIEWDGEISGFGVVVQASGRKSFILNYRYRGEQKRHTFGRYGAWTVQAARDEAADWRRRLDRGEDPKAERKAEQARKTVRDAYELTLQSKWSQASPAWRSEVRRYFEGTILPAIGSEPLEELRPETIESLKQHLPDKPYAQNRMLSALKTALNKAKKMGWMLGNPADAVETNREHVRIHRLEPAQLLRIWEALYEAHDKTARDVIRLLMLTGVRPGTAFRAQWPEFTSDFAVWKIPREHTKHGNEEWMPLAGPAQDMLKKRWEEFQTFMHVFQGPRGMPISGVRKTWKSALRKAGLPADTQIRCLRDSYATGAFERGHSFQEIRIALGHSNERTTQRYVHAHWMGKKAISEDHARSIFESEPADIIREEMGF